MFKKLILDTPSPSLEDEKKAHLRPICSFVRRQGRLTNGQQRALQQLWPQMGIEYQPKQTPLMLFFGRQAPLIVEVGFGMGHTLVEIAQAHPENNFLGIEVHLPGVGACLAAAQQRGLTNLRLICHDAVAVLEQMVPDHSLAGVQLFFPDPWHKKRHHKRRLVQASFINLLQHKLQAEGILHLATDWQPYAEQMLALLKATAGYRNLSPTGDYVPRPDWRPLTKFEQRGHRLGHRVWDLRFSNCMT